MSARFSRIRVAGFRSLRDVALDLTPITVLIGPNGAGKSNLLWALELTRFIAFESLQLFVSERGGATYLMHYGPKRTAAIDIELEFTQETGHNAWHARLGYGADEGLLFLWERAGFRRTSDQDWRWSELGAGHRESISTQSTALLDLFEPNQVVVAERHDGATTLRRLVEEELADWLTDYRLSEVYESNLIGGRP
jgi:hypothetical protein